jgi:L-2-hydroxyglutarate oxidase LhgO
MDKNQVVIDKIIELSKSTTVVDKEYVKQLQKLVNKLKKNVQENESIEDKVNKSLKQKYREYSRLWVEDGFRVDSKYKSSNVINWTYDEFVYNIKPYIEECVKNNTIFNIDQKIVQIAMERGVLN